MRLIDFFFFGWFVSIFLSHKSFIRYIALDSEVKITNASMTLGQTLSSKASPDVNAATITKPFLLHWRGLVALNNEDHTTKRYLNKQLNLIIF